jgi:phosphate transport system substrate-binding protein
MRACVLLAFSCVAAFATGAFAEELTIVGTGDGVPVFKALESAFTSEKPDTKIILPQSIHSSGGIREVGVGNAVLGRIARPLQGEETELGIHMIPVFHQPAVFYAHPAAKVNSLSCDQLKKIFSGAITNWSEVGGPDLRIKVVRREEADSALAIFRQTLPGWKELEFDVNRSRLATSTQESFDSVRATPGAIGFGPFSTGLESDYIVIRLDGISPAEPNYPSAITLALIYRDKNVTKEAFQFIDFIFTPKAAKIIRQNGGIPVARETRSRS